MPITPHIFITMAANLDVPQASHEAALPGNETTTFTGQIDRDHLLRKSISKTVFPPMTSWPCLLCVLTDLGREICGQTNKATIITTILVFDLSDNQGVINVSGEKVG